MSKAQSIACLLMSDLVNSTQWVRILGDQKAAMLAQRHDEVARDLMKSHGGLELEKTDGFLIVFERPILAINYAMAYHQALARISTEFAIEFRARIGIRLCELPLEHSPQSNQLQIDRLIKRQTDRLMSLAAPNQTLVTPSILELSLETEHWNPEWKWIQYDSQSLEGWSFPIILCEVGIPGQAPFTKPGCSSSRRWNPEKGKRMLHHDHWTLEKDLSREATGIQRWVASHHKTKEQRLFIFSQAESDLTELRRMVAIGRLLKMEFDGQRGVAPLLDWDLDQTPYLIQYGLPENGNLGDWVKEQGGIECIPMETRMDLVAQLALTLQKAHSIGILHKHINPGCIWIEHGKLDSIEDRSKHLRVQLTDFDTTSLQSEEMLQQSGITTRGLDLRSINQMTPQPIDVDVYLAPERLAGKPATIQGDIYALGVLLYQLAIGSFEKSVGHGWDREIGDSNLRSIIANAIDGRPDKRFGRAGELADRLRTSSQHSKKRSGQPGEEETCSIVAANEEETHVFSFRSPALGFGLAVLFAVLLLLNLLGVLT